MEPLRRGATEAPLLKENPLTLEKLAEYPIVTYDFRVRQPLARAEGVRKPRPEAARC